MGEWYFPGPLPPAGSQIIVSRGDFEGAICPVFQVGQEAGPVWSLARMESCIRLKFRVIDAGGRPVPGARIRVRFGGLLDHEPPVDFVADLAGTVESVPYPIAWIRPGASLWAGSEEGKRATAPLDVETLRAGPLVLRLAE